MEGKAFCGKERGLQGEHRFSYLQERFTALIDLSDADVERVVELGLQHLRVSLPAVSPDARSKLIGPRAQRGMGVLERLMDAGLSMHARVVVRPGVNDGVELARTLGWVDSRPQLLSCGIFPARRAFSLACAGRFFSDDADAAADVIELVRELQEDSGTERRNPKFQLADEFYLDAGYPFPPASAYRGYPQLHDGIGAMRGFIDGWRACAGSIHEQAAKLAGGPAVHVVVGAAFARVLAPLVESSELAGRLKVLPVESALDDDADAAGLMAGCELARALRCARPEGRVLLSCAMLDARRMFSDGMSVQQVVEATGCDIAVCAYSARELVSRLA